MHNYLKNMGENKKYFEMTLGNFLDFFLFFFSNIILLNINWAGPDLAIGLGQNRSSQT